MKLAQMTNELSLDLEAPVTMVNVTDERMEVRVGQAMTPQFPRHMEQLATNVTLQTQRIYINNK